MNKKLIITIAFLMTLFNTQANADIAYNDDMIAQGSLCSGMDCIDGELFGSSTLVLKENNTRIRFLDTSAANVLGQSWIAIANSKNNAGKDYFQFQVRSLEMDAIKISDGNAPLWDCSTEAFPGYYTCTVVGVIPAGDPVLVQGDNTIPNDFVTVPWFTERPVVYFGKAADGGIALGANSEVINSAVSVGKAGLERKIVHVAQALAATDLATVSDINALNKLLDAIDVQLDDIEQTITIIGAPVNTIAPEISGTAEVGNVLIVSTGSWTDRDGDIPSYSYQWQANGSNIASATSNSYTLTTNEAHKTISVSVTATDGKGANTASASGTTVLNMLPVNTASPVISGMGLVGNTLTASTGSWLDADGDSLTNSYQWKANGINISSATTNSYTLTTSEAHKVITFTATANDGNGGNTAVSSNGISMINAPLVKTVTPVISGTAGVGNVLNISTGTWADADGDIPTYNYQWLANGSIITSASTNSYTITTSEAHKNISVMVTANDGNGSSATAFSTATFVVNAVPVNTLAPVITGAAIVGQVLSSSSGNWTDADGDTPTYSYQWTANGVNIVGATSNSYTLSVNETGKAIAVIVTAADGNGGNINASSNVTAAVDSDFDLDGTGDSVDTDDDNDGVLDTDDAFPLDPSESVDSDSDGVGDNTDAHPNDASETLDTDADGIGNNADMDDDNDGLPDMFEIALGLDPLYASDANYDLDADMYSNLVEYSFGSRLDVVTSVPSIALLGADTDGDGIPDINDAFPNDPIEFIDTDGDGIGNRADTDDDNDGVSDNFDAMPLDDSEVDDSDGDNVGDNTDAFPNDATESVDTDLDGVGNNSDTDIDGDGVDNSLDAFPLDATESADFDGDGVGDNADAFPTDSSETVDTDNDGTGNNTDTDDDGDSVLDAADNCPLVSNIGQEDDNLNGIGNVCEIRTGTGGSFAPGLLLLLSAPLVFFRNRRQHMK